jgi:hypothetical protein
MANNQYYCIVRMSRRLSAKEVNDKCNARNIELLDPFLIGIDNVESHKKCKCRKCYYEWKPRLANAFKRKCPNCSGKKLPLTKNQIIERLLKQNIELVDDYIMGKDTIALHKKCRCKECNNEWEPALYRAFDGLSRCPICADYKNIPFTKDKILKKLTDNNIELLEDYTVGTDTVNSRKKCRCLICNYGIDGEWRPELRYLFNINGCVNCSGYAPYTDKFIDTQLIDRNIKRLGECINSQTNIAWQCLEKTCSHIWAATPINVIHAETGCPSCAGFLTLTNAIVDQRLLDNNIPIKRIGNYNSIRIAIDWQCLNKNCNKIWDTTPDHILNIRTGCPDCKLGVNQKIMIDLLRKFDTDFISEFKLRNIDKSARLSAFDAYSAKYNIAVEYDGAQHFGPTIFGNMSKEQAEERWDIQQEYDAYKNNFCKDKKIDLIRIDGRKYKKKNLKQYITNEIIPKIKCIINLLIPQINPIIDILDI